MKNIQIALFILTFIVSISINAVGTDVVYTKQDSLIYESYIASYKTKKDIPINSLIVQTAIYFLDRPYVGATLEASETEQLIINLREFDCTTFVENCIVLSQVICSGDTSFNNYCRLLKELRYRNGVIDDYTSRLHYMSDWIYENEKRGILDDKSLTLNGVKINKSIDFMSSNAVLYPHLKNNEQNIQRMSVIEHGINDRGHYYIVPSKSIKYVEDNILDGDIIVFATSTSGLDYSHVAIAHRIGNQLRFVHASSLSKKTIIDSRSLSEYCLSSKTCSGISILRIKNN